jgi:hypothetical protein
MGPEGYGTLTVSIIGYCRQCGNTLVSRRSMPWVDKKADYYVYREYWMTLYMTLREFVGNFVSIPDKVMEVPKNAGG